MPDFYFTYGTSKVFPFRGGWTRVTAPSINVALSAFVAVHPNIYNSINCANYYTEDEFLKTSMVKEGNYGAFEHEHISKLTDIKHSLKEKRPQRTAILKRSKEKYIQLNCKGLLSKSQGE